MRTIITLAVCILMVTLSFWVVSIDEPTIKPQARQPAFTPSELEIPNIEAQPKAVKSVQLESSTEVVALTASLILPETHSSLLPMNVADINSLPSEMQQEIKVLSGRDNSASLISEVSPGVFLNSGGPRVVPVAVVNSDGTVSTHEY